MDERARRNESWAGHLRLSLTELGDVWKDQRELKSHEVLAIAQFLEVTPAEIADRAGVSTPVPLAPADASPTAARLEELNGRLIKLERMMVELKALLLERKP